MRTKNFTLLNVIFVFFLVIKAVNVNCQGTTQTPMGQTVYLGGGNDSPEWIALWEADAASEISMNNWDAIRIGAATSHYNCHSYAWNIFEGGSSINSWLNQIDYGYPNLSKYWTNDAYVSTTLISDHEKIFYSSGDHSAVTTAITGKVKSKWGCWPLFQHSTSQCPYNSSALVYFKLKTPTISNSGGVLCTGSQRSVNNGYVASNWSYDWSAADVLNQISGDGTPTYTVSANSGVGIGYINLTVTSPSGMTVSTNSNVGVKMPLPDEVPFSLYTSEGSPVSYMCPNRQYHIYLNNYSGCELSNYTWSVPSQWSINYTYNNMISIYTNSSSGGMVEVSANTCCGNFTKVKTGYFSGGYCESSYSLVLSPNPTSGETSIGIKSVSEDVTFDENAEWELEIFDQMQILKERKVKIKGSISKINTAGWKTGIYYVRVKFKNEYIEGKLLVR